MDAFMFGVLVFSEGDGGSLDDSAADGGLFRLEQRLSSHRTDGEGGPYRLRFRQWIVGVARMSSDWTACQFGIDTEEQY
jgi:hypothetical protein